MLSKRRISASEAIFTVIVIATGVILAAPIMFTTSYFVMMFS